jgi:iron complex outermembrane receptor protein
MDLKARLYWGIAAAALTLPFAPPPTLAQTQLEEIVVTAQRRAESVQTVPIAVSAFSPNELQRRNITTTLDIVKFVPNLMGHNNTGPATSNTYFLRGLGNTDTLATIDLPVATYIDEVVLSRQNANQLSFFAVDRIEVLRGPQGTLFGRNVTGGAIAVYLRKPSEETQGSASIAYGRFNFKEARGSVDVPLSDKVLTQIAAFYNDDNGFVTNVANNEKLNDLTNYGARLAIRALASDQLTWDGSVNYLKSEGTNLFHEVCDSKNPGAIPNPCPGRWIRSGYSGAGMPPASTLLIGAAPPTNVPGTLTGDKAGFEPQTTKANTWIGISNFQYEVNEALTVNAITGYVRTEQNINFDLQSGRPGRGAANPGLTGLSPFTLGATGQPHPYGGGFTLLQGAVTKQFTQEFKATGNLFDDRLKYVGGVYYFDETSNTDIGDVFPLGGSNNAIIGRDQLVRNTTEAWAGYAQFDYSITEQLIATAGIRYTDERKRFETTDNRSTLVQPTVTVGGVVRNNRLATANLAQFGYPDRLVAKIWTPRFALNYQATDDVLIYASATRGFRSGGWNARGAGANALAPFFPEKVWSYETGIKSEWFDNRLRVNLNLFHMDVKQFQFPASFVAPGATAPSFITQNDAALRNQGVEIDAQVILAEGLTVFGTLGYQNAKYRDLGTGTAAQLANCRASIARNDPAAVRFSAAGGCTQGIITFDGQVAEPARTPPWTASIGVNYEIPVESLGVKFIPNVSASYSGEFESAAANVSFFRNANGTYTLNRAEGGEFAGGSLTESYWLINASFAIADLEDTYRFAVECSNCFGEVYNTAGFLGYSFWSPPGRWRVSLSANF